jgi:hemerythrin superfamily protein
MRIVYVHPPGNQTIQEYTEGVVMNAFQLLKEDHKKVAGIFEKLEPTTERGVKTREELFTQLKTELDIHAHIEETIFYPALKEADETHDIILEGYEEHKVVKTLLGELEELSKDQEEWGAKLKVLQENVEHHVEEEEGEMFKNARKVLTEEQAEELGARMEAAKTEEKNKTAAA